MTIFTLRDSRTPRAPSQPVAAATSQRRAEVAVGIVVIVAIVAFVVGGFALVYHYFVKFNFPNVSQSSVTVTETQGVSGNITVTKVRTVYANPKYNLTLGLPGKWQPAARAQEGYFCTLMRDDGFTARFRPIFEIVYTPVDRYAEILGRAYLEMGWTLVTNSPIEINGRAGRTMRLQKNVSGADETLQATMVKEWPAIYVLTIIGPRDSSAWSGITDALPQSIEVK